MDQILINEKGVQVHFHVGTFHYERELRPTGSSGLGTAPGALTNIENSQSGLREGTPLRRPRSGPFSKYSVYRSQKNLDTGSKTLINGGGGGNRTPVRKRSTVSHYMLSYLFKRRFTVNRSKARESLPQKLLSCALWRNPRATETA